MKKLIFFFAILSALVVFQSCDKESVVDIPDGLAVPQLPPSEMYTIPTGTIAHSDSLIDDHDRCPRENWIHAGLSMLVWNSVVVVNMAVPVGAFGLAFNEDAQYIGNSTFAWTYQYHAGGRSFDVELTGQYISTTEVEWILTLSEVGGFNNFQWIKGIVSTDLTQAGFTLFRNPTNPESYLEINTTRDPIRQLLSVRLTNAIPNDPGNGHYIEYSAMNNANFNRGFQLFAGAGNQLDIEWNEPTRDGRVRHPFYFNNSDWHCWDVNQCNTTCN